MSWVQASRIQHPDDIRDALGFSGEPGGFDMLSLYQRALQNSEPYSRGDLRLAWKIACDPYYWAAFKRYQSLQTIVNAGFFDDGLEPGTLAPLKNPHMLTTPLETIRARVTELETQGRIHNKKLLVLLTTGCFAPIHDGHIAMMEKAKEAAETQGYEVIGGFMSPSHDDYVSTKGEDARRLTADYRTLLISKALEGKDWLSADPWESRYAPTDINFTDTVQRLRDYINAHINSAAPIEVGYVFGADNVQFARAFIDKGVAICVPRPGLDAQLKNLVEKNGLSDHPNLILAGSSGLDISSTKVRAGETPSIKNLEGDAIFKELLKGEARRTAASDATQTYLVRDDLGWATDQWRGKVQADVLQKAINNFRAGLVRALENAFERSHAPGYPRKVDIVLLSVEEQMKEARALMDVKPEWVINNDVITGGAHNAIGISRLFNLSAPQLRSHELVSRPGRQNLAQLFGRLRKGDYQIVDDDIATGTTIRMLEQKLPEGVKFTSRVALSESAFKKVHPDKEYAFWDIVDARDFLMGSKNAGLVVRLFNGAVARAPYILPYTSLTARAKIPPDQEMAFTKEILNLNRRFFRDVWADINLADTDPQFQALMKTAGFRGKTHLSDLCSWHQTVLRP